MRQPKSDTRKPLGFFSSPLKIIGKCLLNYIFSLSRTCLPNSCGVSALHKNNLSDSLVECVACRSQKKKKLNNLISCADFTFFSLSLHFMIHFSKKKHTADRCKTRCCLIWWAADMHSPSYTTSCFFSHTYLLHYSLFKLTQATFIWRRWWLFLQVTFNWV